MTKYFNIEFQVTIRQKHDQFKLQLTSYHFLGTNTEWKLGIEKSSEQTRIIAR